LKSDGLKKGNTMPKPKPAETHKITLHVPKDLHRALVIHQGQCQVDTGKKTSLNSIICEALEGFLTKKGAMNK
jgi:hypothetical protein